MDELSNLFGGAEQVWQYITQYAAKAGREATRIVLESYYVVKSPNTPAIDKTIIIAALGYQLLPDDKKLLSREKYGLLGLLDNGAALALAYNRVKARVTPQIEAQVDAILNQWFGSERPQIDEPSEHPQIPSGNNDFGGNYWNPQPASSPAASETPISTNRPNTSLVGFSDDEDVVID
jgi:uncharacterized membrane protein YkvA (DUF1232 family)